MHSKASKLHTLCDLANSALLRSGITYRNEAASGGTAAIIRVGDKVVASYDGNEEDAAVMATPPQPRCGVGCTALLETPTLTIGV